MTDLDCGCRINPPHPDRLCPYHEGFEDGTAELATTYMEVANRHREAISFAWKRVVNGVNVTQSDGALVAITEAMRAVIADESDAS